MDIRSLDPGIEVSGTSLGAIIEGFKAFRSVAMKIMAANGLVSNDPAKKGMVDTNAWYPFEKWLKAHYAMGAEVGPNVLFEIGESIPRNAIFPPSVVGLESALQSVDVAYHLNHRKNGVVMFDLSSGKMLEGIGHYGFYRATNERKITMLCDNPYECKFDQGIISAMAKRFESRAIITHDEKKSCRAKGGMSCTYTITW